MMLGKNYRFAVNNKTGVAVGVVIKARKFKFASDGSLTFDSSESTLYNQASISSGSSWTADTGVDNSTDKYMGADLSIAITPSASATGPVTVEIEHSTDGGTTWPNGGDGVPIAGAYFSASSAARTLSVRVE